MAVRPCPITKQIGNFLGLRRLRASSVICMQELYKLPRHDKNSFVACDTVQCQTTIIAFDYRFIAGSDCANDRNDRTPRVFGWASSLTCTTSLLTVAGGKYRHKKTSADCLFSESRTGRKQTRHRKLRKVPRFSD